MELSDEIRNLLITLINSQIITASWGISNIRFEKNMVGFTVHGMKYQGEVSISGSGENVYDIRLGTKCFESTKLEDVIDRMDKYVELTNNYDEDVSKWLSPK